MKIYKKIIHECKDCPQCRRVYFDRFTCDVKDRAIKTLEIIPKWCPLDDAAEQSYAQDSKPRCTCGAVAPDGVCADCHEDDF